MSRTAVRRPEVTTTMSPLASRRLERGRAVRPLEVGEAEPLAHGEQLEHGQAGRLDAGQVLGHQFVERRRRRQRPDEVPRAARVDQHVAARARRARAR